MAQGLTSIELFAGGGGLLLGCSLAGFSHDLAVEWNGPSCDTLRANVDAGYPLIEGTSVYEGDVRSVDWTSAPSGVDLLAGGPPCQPFSLGGLARAALDERDMFPALTHALSFVRPRAFIVENVKGLTRPSFSDYYQYILLRLQHPRLFAREGETWREHLERLSREHTSGVHDDLRYEVVPTVVDAADYGVPQHRERVVLVGFRSDVNADWSFPVKTHSGAALARSKSDGTYWDRHGVPLSQRTSSSMRAHGDPALLPWRTVRDALEGMPEPQEGGVPGWFNHELRLGAKVYPGHTGSYIDEPSKAIKAGVHGVPGGENMIRFSDGSVRYYSVREAARIQGFPDRYRFAASWGEAMRQIGNAVPVTLARIVASSVADALRLDDARRAFDTDLMNEMRCASGASACRI